MGLVLIHLPTFLLAWEWIPFLPWDIIMDTSVGSVFKDFIKGEFPITSGQMYKCPDPRLFQGVM